MAMTFNDLQGGYNGPTTYTPPNIVGQEISGKGASTLS